MTPPDPPRLLGQLHTPDALREALRGARGDLPSPDRLDRLASRLGPSVLGPGATPGPPPAAPAPPAPVAASLTSTVIAPALVSGALTLGLLGAAGLWPSSAPPASGPTPPPSALSVSSPARVALPTRPLSAPSPGPPGPPPLVPPGPAPVASAALRPTSPAAPDRPTAAATPEPTDDAPGTMEPPYTPATAAPESEASLLHRARESLGGSPAATLDLVAAHERLYPGGVLTQERELLAIEALARQGRSGDARARAERFVSQFPRSAHLRRLQTLVPELERGRDGDLPHPLPAPQGGGSEGR